MFTIRLMNAAHSTEYEESGLSEDEVMDYLDFYMDEMTRGWQIEIDKTED